MKGIKIIKLLLNTYNRRSVVLDKKRIKIYKYLNINTDHNLRYADCYICKIRSIYLYEGVSRLNIIIKDILNNEWFFIDTGRYCSNCYNK